MSATGSSNKVIILALLANLGIALVKFGAAFFSKSASMLAEAIHSLVDTSNQVLLLIGAKKSEKKPDDIHPLGYGREAYFWSFIVAILLFSLGGLFAIYEGAHKLSSETVIERPYIAFAVLFISVILESVSFHACLKEVRKQNTHGSLFTWLHKTTSSELLVVFTEDAAALSGLVIATLCLLTAVLTGNPIWDAIGSILVGSLLVIVAVFLAAEIKSLIIGEAATIDFKPFIEQELDRQIPGSKLLRLVALQIGASEVMLSIKISPGRVTDVTELINGINAFEVRTKQEFPQIRWQFVEPDFIA